MKKTILLPIVGVVLLGAAGGTYYVMRSRDHLRQGSQALQGGDLKRAQIEFRNAVRANPKSGEAHFALAVVEARLGDALAAEKDLREALTDGYDQTKIKPALAQSLIDQGRFKDVLTEFPAPDAPPEFAARIGMGRAMAYMGLRDLGHATSEIDTALKRAPDLADAEVVAAQVAIANRDPALAERHVDHAIAVDPKAVQAYAMKGELQLARGEKDAALKSLDNAIELNPNFVAARLSRANISLAASDDAKTKSDVDAVLSVAPRNVLGLYFRGVLALRAKNWAQADESFGRINQYLPNFPKGLYLAAVTKQNLGQLEQAADFADRYASRNPTDIEGIKLQARIAMANQHLDVAQDLLTKAAAKGTADAETLDLLGRAYSLAGQKDRAAQSFQKAADLAPQNTDILTRLASTRLDMGDAAGATADLEKTLRADPKSANAGETLVVAALAAGDIPKAEAALAKLHEAQGDSEAVMNLGGLIAAGKGDLDGARRDFEGVIKAYPKTVTGRLNLGRVLAQQGKAADAEKVFMDIYDQDPSNETALQTLVGTMLATNRVSDAVALVQKAHDAKPGNPVLTSALADLHTRSGNADKALALLDQVPGDQVNTPTILGARARAQIALRRMDDAKETYRKVLASNPKDLNARDQLTQMLVGSNDLENARKVVNEGLAVTPANFGMLETLTRIESKLHGFDAALKLADQLAADPTHQPEAKLLKGDLYMFDRQFAKASDTFAEQFKREPSSVMALRLAGAQGAAGHTDQAAQTLSDWTVKNPADLGALQMLASIELQTKQTDKAEAHFETIVAKAPRDALALNNLAWLLAEKQDTRSVDLARRAYAISPTPEIADTYGWCLVVGGQPAQAVPLLQQAAARMGTNPGVQYHLGMALKASGQKDDALRAFTVAASTSADVPEKALAQKEYDALKDQK